MLQCPPRPQTNFTERTCFVTAHPHRLSVNPSRRRDDEIRARAPSTATRTTTHDLTKQRVWSRFQFQWYIATYWFEIEQGDVCYVTNENGSRVLQSCRLASGWRATRANQRGDESLISTHSSVACNFVNADTCNRSTYLSLDSVTNPYYLSLNPMTDLCTSVIGSNDRSVHTKMVYYKYLHSRVTYPSHWVRVRTHGIPVRDVFFSKVCPRKLEEK